MTYLRWLSCAVARSGGLPLPRFAAILRSSSTSSRLIFSAPSLLEDLWASVDRIGEVGEFSSPERYCFLVEPDRKPLKKIQDLDSTDISGSSPGSGTSDVWSSATSAGQTTYWVSRTFSWLGQNRRMSKDYERLCAISEAFVYAAMTRLMVRRLART